MIEFEDDGDEQCIAINSIFSEELTVFLKYLQQFCFSIAGRCQQIQTLFAAELHFLCASRSIAKTGFLVDIQGVCICRSKGLCDVFDPWVRWERGQVGSESSSGGVWKSGNLKI